MTAGRFLAFPLSIPRLQAVKGEAMDLKLKATFTDVPEMLAFMGRLHENPAETTNLQTILDRINQMANTQIADLISSMQGNFASLNAEQARAVAALDRVLAQQAEMPARIQAAVDAAMANGVDAEQIAALTALGDAVTQEVAEAKAEADKLEAASPPPAPATPTDTVPPVVTDPNGPVVNTPDAGGDTTAGGTPAPNPAG